MFFQLRARDRNSKRPAPPKSSAANSADAAAEKSPIFVPFPMESVPDDLEIRSVGALYRGPWDKKYWSCSRGKDRYPYPIGYHAVRIHAGSTYSMEIHEGLKGPVFLVTSVGGDSCTGQTPDIAWQNFQKKSGPSVKNWQGKRFSCKVDGVELFGFRNPFVQRLLRELVANINGIAERSLPSTFCNEASESQSKMCMQDSHAYPDLLPYLGKRQRTGYRTKKNKASIRLLCKEAMLKRIQCNDLPNDAVGGTSEQADQHRLHTKNNSLDPIIEESVHLAIDGSFEIQVDSNHLNHSSKDCLFSLNGVTPDVSESEYQNVGKSTRLANSVNNFVVNKNQGFSAMQVDVSTVVEENYHPFFARNELVEAELSDCVAGKNFIPCEQLKAESLNITDAEERHCHTEEGQLVRLSDDLLKQQHPFVDSKDTVGEISAMAGYSDAFVPDTCDAAGVDTAGVALENAKGTLSDTKHELVASKSNSSASTLCISKIIDGSVATEYVIKSKNAPSDSTCIAPTETCTLRDVLSKGLIQDSLQVVDSSSGSPNPNSERIDLDLAGRELAKSMMTFLLPRAVPLLKKTYVRRRSRYRKRDVKHDPSKAAGANSAEVNSRNDHRNEYTLQGKPVVGTLNEETEEEVPKKLIEPQTMPGFGFLCEVDKLQPLVGSCTIDEPNTANEIKSVVQDSFDDDKNLGIITINKPLHSALDEADAARGEEIALKNNTSRSEGLENAKSVSSDSLAASKHANKMVPFKPKSDEDRVREDANTSCHNYGTPVGIAMGSHNAEPFEGSLPSSSNCKKFGCNEALKGTQSQSYSKNSSSSEKLQSSNPHEQVKLDVHVVDSRVFSRTPQIGLGGKAMFAGKGNSSVYSMPNALCSTSYHSSDSFKAEIPQPPFSTGMYDDSPSESIVCRDLENHNGSNTCVPPNISYKLENVQGRDRSSDGLRSIPVGNGTKINKKPNLFEAVKSFSKSESTAFTVAPYAYENHDVVNKVTGDIQLSKLFDPSVSGLKKNGKDGGAKLPSPMEWRKSFSDASTNLALEASSCLDNNLPVDRPINNICKNIFSNQVYHNDIENYFLKDMNSTTLELAGCYLHPQPVLSIYLSSKEDYLQISVLCGIMNSKDRNLFMYMVPIKEQRGGHPAFLGYTSLVLPLLEGPCDGNVSFERSRLQFTPDDPTLVFLNNLKAPHCREQNIGCLCSNCKSDCREEYAVEVAYMKFGYVSLVAKLTTIERISCILFCDPYLIAAEQSGRLHVWIKNQTWSMLLEDFSLPTIMHISPAILDLKRIPKSDSIIIGHNGTGGFGVWDISRRVLLACFSYPGNTIFQIVPVSLFSWQDQCTLASYQKHESSVPTTNNRLPKAGGTPTAMSPGEDLAVWLLVSAAPDSAARHGQVEQLNMCRAGGWRLAILAKNTMVMGSILDPRASAVDAVAEYGIIGTCQGILYKWDLSTGEKLADLRSLNCGILRIAIDAQSGAVAVAGDNSQLVIYVQR